MTDLRKRVAALIAAAWDNPSRWRMHAPTVHITDVEGDAKLARLRKVNAARQVKHRALPDGVRSLSLPLHYHRLVTVLLNLGPDAGGLTDAESRNRKCVIAAAARLISKMIDAALPPD